MWKFLIPLLLLPATTSAQNMMRVPKTDGYCATNDETYCYEWSLSKEPTIRFIARGDEDVIDYAFYRTVGGIYKEFAIVLPILRDPRFPDQIFWGYPWDISDIEVAAETSELSVLASVNHNLRVTDVEGNVISDELLPAVLFLGHTTQPEFAPDAIEFVPISIATLGYDG